MSLAVHVPPNEEGNPDMHHSSDFEGGALPIRKQLTPLQEAYCHFFVLTNCKAEAMRRAGSRSKNPALDGYKMHMKPEVQAKITELRLERIRRLAIDADYVLERLVEEANADLSDIFSDNFDLKPISEWPEVWRRGLVAAFNVRQIKGDPAKCSEKTRVKMVKMRFSDRIARLRAIGNHVNVRAFR